MAISVCGARSHALPPGPASRTTTSVPARSRAAKRGALRVPDSDLAAESSPHSGPPSSAMTELVARRRSASSRSVAPDQKLHRCQKRLHELQLQPGAASAPITRRGPVRCPADLAGCSPAAAATRGRGTHRPAPSPPPCSTRPRSCGRTPAAELAVAARWRHVKISSGKNADTRILGTSTSSLIARSTATLQIA